MNSNGSRLSVHVGVFGGADIKEAIRDLTDFARRVGIWVTADINGIHVMTSPDDNPDTLWGNYEKARERNATFVSANVIPRGRTPILERDGVGNTNDGREDAQP